MLLAPIRSDGQGFATFFWTLGESESRRAGGRWDRAGRWMSRGILFSSLEALTLLAIWIHHLGFYLKSRALIREPCFQVQLCTSTSLRCLNPR